MKLLQTWVKHPKLKEASLLIISECLPTVWPERAAEFSQGRVVLSICPEAEADQHVIGKLASIIRSSCPKELTVLTVGGSPHCALLHGLVNEAVYITQAYNLPVQQFVVIEGKAHRISTQTIRVARYLNLVEKLVRAHPEVVDELARLSLEQRAEKEAKGANPNCFR